MKRRHALLLTTSAAALALTTPTLAQKATTLRLRLSWTAFGLSAAVFYAMERGWFKACGVDLQVEDGSGSTATVNFVGAGQYDIGEAAVSAMIIARDKGMPLKSIADFVRGTELGVLVPKGANLKTPKDLEGKKVAFTAGSLEGPFMEAFLKAGGADPKKVELLNVDFSSKIPTYLASRSDAVVTTVPFVLPLVAEKRPSDTIMFGDYGFVLPSIGYIATEQAIRTKSQALQCFVTAMSRAWTDILENGKLEEALDALAKHRPQATLSRADAKAQIEFYRPYFQTANTKGKPQGWHPPEDWKAAVESMQNVGLVKSGSKPEEFYTNEFFAR